MGDGQPRSNEPTPSGGSSHNIYSPFLRRAQHESITGPGSPTRRADVWQKVLWKRQNYPDNFTDETFLQELVINADVPRRSFWKVVLGSFVIAQQLSIAVVVIVLPAYFRQPHPLLLQLVPLAVALVILSGYLAGLGDERDPLSSVVNAVDQVSIVSCGTYVGAPLLRAAAQALGRDSLIACIFFLQLAHLYSCDYNFKVAPTESFLGAASQVAAIGSAVLASTFIPDALHTLLYTLLAASLTLIAPHPRQRIRHLHPAPHTALTALAAAAAHRLLVPLAPTLASVLLMALVFICLLCPWWLVRIHKFKAKINGPWDEAVPRLPTALSFPCTIAVPLPNAGTQAAPQPHPSHTPAVPRLPTALSFPRTPSAANAFCYDSERMRDSQPPPLVVPP